MLVIPVQPSPYDVWAAEETLKLVEEATVHKDSLKSVFAINRKIVNTAIGRDVEEALNRYPVPILATHIHQGVSFAESALGGLIVSETDPILWKKTRLHSRVNLSARRPVTNGSMIARQSRK